MSSSTRNDKPVLVSYDHLVSFGLVIQWVARNPGFVVIQHLNAEYTVGTVIELPYSDGQLDVVFSCLLFHLLDDAERELAFREIYRVLKPGGKYVCAEFEKYPTGFVCRRLLDYPNDLMGVVGFDVDTQLPGPSITKCHSIIYRNLVRPGG